MLCPPSGATGAPDARRTRAEPDRGATDRVRISRHRRHRVRPSGPLRRGGVTRANGFRWSSGVGPPNVVERRRDRRRRPCTSSRTSCHGGRGYNGVEVDRRRRHRGIAGAAEIEPTNAMSRSGSSGRRMTSSFWWWRRRAVPPSSSTSPPASHRFDQGARFSARRSAPDRHANATRDPAWTPFGARSARTRSPRTRTVELLVGVAVPVGEVDPVAAGETVELVVEP